MVIFHSYVSLPEGKHKTLCQPIIIWYIVIAFLDYIYIYIQIDLLVGSYDWQISLPFSLSVSGVAEGVSTATSISPAKHQVKN